LGAAGGSVGGVVASMGSFKVLSKGEMQAGCYLSKVAERHGQAAWGSEGCSVREGNSDLVLILL